MKNLKIAALLIAALGACVLAGCSSAPADAEKPAAGTEGTAPAGDATKAETE